VIGRFEKHEGGFKMAVPVNNLYFHFQNLFLLSKTIDRISVADIITRYWMVKYFTGKIISESRE